MKNKRFIIYIGIIVFLVTIIVVAGFKVHFHHIDKLYYVVHQKIKETALKCYLEEACEGEITLNDLYEKDYLKDFIIDPVTKEEMDKNLCLKYDGEAIEFC